MSLLRTYAERQVNFRCPGNLDHAVDLFVEALSLRYRVDFRRSLALRELLREGLFAYPDPIDRFCRFIPMARWTAS